MVRALVLIMFSLLLSGCIPGAQLEQGPGIIGTYVVNGVDPLGTEYTGRMSITAGNDLGEVVVEWVVTGAILHGEGRVEGNILEVDWVTNDGPRGASSGTARYEIMPDGRLVGTRTIDGVDGTGTEEIFPNP